MFERFTDRARRVVVLAQEEARMLRHNYIGTEHLLLGLIAEGSGVGAVALQRLDVDLVRARAQVTAIIGASSAETPQGHIPFTPRAKHALELALRESMTLNHNYIGTEHVLLGLLREADGVGAQVLIRCGASLDTVRQTVIDVLTTYSTSMPPASSQPVLGDRWSPGLRAALDLAAGRAADAVTVGTHHVLSVFAERLDMTAGRVLQAGGFDPAKLTTPIAQADVADTLDETAAQWGMRIAEVETTDDAVVIGLHDPELRARIKSAIDGGNSAAVQAALGEALKQMQLKLPPVEPSVSETDPPDAPDGEASDAGDGDA